MYNLSNHKYLISNLYKIIVHSLHILLTFNVTKNTLNMFSSLAFIFLMYLCAKVLTVTVGKHKCFKFTLFIYF